MRSGLFDRGRQVVRCARLLRERQVLAEPRAIGEPGIAGWVIYLDDNNNGALDAGERFTTTDANGNYTLALVPPAVYVVAEESKPGWTQTAPTAFIWPTGSLKQDKSNF